MNLAFTYRSPTKNPNHFYSEHNGKHKDKHHDEPIENEDDDTIFTNGWMNAEYEGHGVVLKYHRPIYKKIVKKHYDMSMVERHILQPGRVGEHADGDAGERNVTKRNGGNKSGDKSVDKRIDKPVDKNMSMEEVIHMVDNEKKEFMQNFGNYYDEKNGAVRTSKYMSMTDLMYLPKSQCGSCSK
jgi:hypothetical protein